MVHIFKQNGYNIVFDVESGAVHSVDDLTYDVLTKEKTFLRSDAVETLSVSFPNYPKDEISEVVSELRSLYSEGLLYSEEFVPEGFIDENADLPVKALCLNVAHDCNLRCSYCFASTGDFGEGRKLMPFETAKAAIDFVIASSKGRRNIEVDFFGGEPLMNFEVVKQTVAYARSIEKEHGKNFRFTITTNGMLLDDEKAAYINREMHNCVLSLDGRKEVNDKMRVTAAGKGSYDVIVPKFKKLIASRDGEYYVRGTFTKFNTDFSEDVRHVRELGFTQISVEPVVSPASCPWALTEKEVPAVLAEYEKLAFYILDLKKKGDKINFFHFNIDLDDGPCILKRLKGCGCGSEYVAVTPDGDIYPCHQFVGDKAFIMGNVREGKIDPDLKKRFKNTDLCHKSECKNCFAKYFCSGGCNANNHAFNGDMLKPYKIGCELQRKRLECSLMIQTALKTE